MRRLAAGIEVGEMSREVGAPLGGLREHRLQPCDLVPQRGHLAIRAIQGVHHQRPPFRGVLAGPEPGPVAGASLVVLQELPDLREGEPGVVTEPADEPETFQVPAS